MSSAHDVAQALPSNEDVESDLSDLPDDDDDCDSAVVLPTFHQPTSSKSSTAPNIPGEHYPFLLFIFRGSV